MKKLLLDIFDHSKSDGTNDLNFKDVSSSISHRKTLRLQYFSFFSIKHIHLLIDFDKKKKSMNPNIEDIFFLNEV